MLIILLSVITFTLNIGISLASETLRSLQSSSKADLSPGVPYTPYTTTSLPLRYYGDDIKMAWSASLGCGACITGGFTYCLIGKEGQDFTGKTVT